MRPRIVDFSTLSPTQRAEAARMLRDAFAPMTDAFAGPEADDEVASFVGGSGRVALAAVEGAVLLGWVGAIEAYDHAWELHPLVVDPPRQREGVGSALVSALEAKAGAAGMLTLYLGTDDEFGGTSLYGADLYPGVAGRIAGIVETAGHPFAFYRKQGYEVVGLIPDANGRGKPDILMAKRIG